MPAVQKHRIPLVAKVAGAAFMAVLMPIYLNTYGITNFLWFCDAALILTMVGMWLESSLLVSMCAVGILILQCLWLADFGSACLGIRFLGLTAYMFDTHLSVFTRGLSLFHGWLPLLLVWLLSRVGYDKRALSAWTVLAAGLGFVCYFFTPPAGAHLTNPNLPSSVRQSRVRIRACLQMLDEAITPSLDARGKYSAHRIWDKVNTPWRASSPPGIFLLLRAKISLARTSIYLFETGTAAQARPPALARRQRSNCGQNVIACLFMVSLPGTN